MKHLIESATSPSTLASSLGAFSSLHGHQVSPRPALYELPNNTTAEEAAVLCCETFSSRIKLSFLVSQRKLYSARSASFLNWRQLNFFLSFSSDTLEALRREKWVESKFKESQIKAYTSQFAIIANLA